VGAVAGFEVSQLPHLGVSGECLEPPSVSVGETQLRAGVGSFPANDHPYPGRPTGGGEIAEHPGQLGDVRALAQAAVGVGGRGPGPWFGGPGSPTEKLVRVADEPGRVSGASP
jgi:hypothetical protein